MSRWSTRPTSRASPRPGSSPRCSRPTRPATGRWPKRGSTRRGWPALMPGRRSLRAARGSRSARTSRSKSPNPFPGLAAAISRQDPNGQPPGGWRPEERVSFEQALAGFTRGAAYAGFAEDRIGSLEPGKWADFILVDRDPTDGRRAGAGRGRRCSKPGSPGRRCGRARASAAAPSAGNKHRRRQDLRQFLGLARPARTTDKAARRRGRGFRGSG